MEKDASDVESLNDENKENCSLIQIQSPLDDRLDKTSDQSDACISHEFSMVMNEHTNPFLPLPAMEQYPVTYNYNQDGCNDNDRMKHYGSLNPRHRREPMGSEDIGISAKALPDSDIVILGKKCNESTYSSSRTTSKSICEPSDCLVRPPLIGQSSDIHSSSTKYQNNSISPFHFTLEDFRDALSYRVERLLGKKVAVPTTHESHVHDHIFTSRVSAAMESTTFSHNDSKVLEENYNFSDVGICNEKQPDKLSGVKKQYEELTSLPVASEKLLNPVLEVTSPKSFPLKQNYIPFHSINTEIISSHPNSDIFFIADANKTEPYHSFSSDKHGIGQPIFSPNLESLSSQQINRNPFKQMEADIYVPVSFVKEKRLIDDSTYCQDMPISESSSLIAKDIPSANLELLGNKHLKSDDTRLIKCESSGANMPALALYTSEEQSAHPIYQNDSYISPTSVSSLTSGKPLEWDNGADIGYAAVNRSEPEGFSLVNKDSNNILMKKNIKDESPFPGFQYLSQAKVGQDKQLVTNVNRLAEKSVDASSASLQDQPITEIEFSQSTHGDKLFLHDNLIPVRSLTRPIKSDYISYDSLSASNTFQLDNTEKNLQQISLVSHDKNIPVGEAAFEIGSTSEIESHLPPSANTNRYLRLRPVDSKDILWQPMKNKVNFSVQPCFINPSSQQSIYNAYGEDIGEESQTSDQEIAVNTDFMEMAKQHRPPSMPDEHSHFFFPNGSSLVILDSNNCLFDKDDQSVSSGKLLSVEGSHFEHLPTYNLEDNIHLRWYPFSDDPQDGVVILPKDAATQTSVSFLAQQSEKCKTSDDRVNNLNDSNNIGFSHEIPNLYHEVSNVDETNILEENKLNHDFANFHDNSHLSQLLRSSGSNHVIYLPTSNSPMSSASNLQNNSILEMEQSTSTLGPQFHYHLRQPVSSASTSTEKLDQNDFHHELDEIASTVSKDIGCTSTAIYTATDSNEARHPNKNQLATSKHISLTNNCLHPKYSSDSLIDPLKNEGSNKFNFMRDPNLDSRTTAVLENVCYSADTSDSYSKKVSNSGSHFSNVYAENFQMVPPENDTWAETICKQVYTSSENINKKTSEITNSQTSLESMDISETANNYDPVLEQSGAARLEKIGSAEGYPLYILKSVEKPHDVLKNVLESQASFPKHIEQMQPHSKPKIKNKYYRETIQPTTSQNQGAQFAGVIGSEFSFQPKTSHATSVDIHQSSLGSFDSSLSSDSSIDQHDGNDQLLTENSKINDSIDYDAIIEKEKEKLTKYCQKMRGRLFKIEKQMNMKFKDVPKKHLPDQHSKSSSMQSTGTDGVKGSCEMHMEKLPIDSEDFNNGVKSRYLLSRKNEEMDTDFKILQEICQRQCENHYRKIQREEELIHALQDIILCHGNKNQSYVDFSTPQCEAPTSSQSTGLHFDSAHHFSPHNNQVNSDYFSVTSDNNQHKNLGKSQKKNEIDLSCTSLKMQNINAGACADFPKSHSKELQYSASISNVKQMEDISLMKTPANQRDKFTASKNQDLLTAQVSQMKNKSCLPDNEDVSLITQSSHLQNINKASIFHEVHKIKTTSTNSVSRQKSQPHAYMEEKSSNIPVSRSSDTMKMFHDTHAVSKRTTFSFARSVEISHELDERYIGKPVTWFVPAIQEAISSKALKKSQRDRVFKTNMETRTELITLLKNTRIPYVAEVSNNTARTKSPVGHKHSNEGIKKEAATKDTVSSGILEKRKKYLKELHRLTVLTTKEPHLDKQTQLKAERERNRARLKTFTSALRYQVAKCKHVNWKRFEDVVTPK